MAYTPSLADINEIDPQPYQPTMADINEIDPQGAITQQPSYLSQLFSKDQPGDLGLNYMASKVAPINAGAAKFGGNIMQDIGSLAKGIGYGEGAPSGADTLQSMGANVANNANQTFGVQPSTASNVIEDVSQYAPYTLAAGKTIASRALSKVPYIGALLSGGAQGATGGAIAGATQSPAGQAVQGAAQGAQTGGEIGVGTEAIAPVLKGIGAAWTGAKGLVGGNLQDVSDNFYQAAAKNPNPTSELPNAVLDPKQLNKLNTENTMANYDIRNNISNGQYDTYKNNDVTNAGYATSGNPEPIKGTPAKTTYLGEQIPATPDIPGAPGKFILPTDSIKQRLNDLLTNDPTKTSLGSVSPAAKGTIQQYLDSPTYNNVHSLQSVLGNERANLQSFTASPSDHSTAAMLKGLRDDINKNTHNTFIANGDGQLSEKLKTISNFNRDNVQVYKDIPSLWNAMYNDGKYPNMRNLMNADSEDINTVRQHILANPEQSRTMLAQSVGERMGNGVKTNPITKEITTTPNRMLNALHNIQGHEQDFAQSAGLNPQIKQVLSQYGRQQYVPKAAKYIGKTALHGAGLATGFEGLHKLKEYL